MQIVSFLHQKGGTGKSTLAVSTALSLAKKGGRVLLLDCDYQGTTTEWGTRYGLKFGVEVRSQVQPIVHTEAKRFAENTDFLVIDGPPSLSPMTQSILQTGGRIIIPTRPSKPDIWALAWLAAIVAKMEKEGVIIQPLVVFNQHRGEDLEKFRKEMTAAQLPLHPEPLPFHAGFSAVFEGEPLSEELMGLMLGLL